LRILRRIFRFFFGIFRAIVWTAGLIAIAIVCYFYVAARPVPRETLGNLLARLSTETDALDARNASFGLREGLVLRKVRLLPKGVVAPEWFSAEELRLSGGFRPDRPPHEWIDSVVAYRINISSLPASLTGGVSTATGAAPTAMPALPSMRFDLVDATFLGMRFKRLQGLFRQDHGKIYIDDVRIEWPSDRWTEEATGHVCFDPATGYVEGQIAGRTVPDRVYPLLRMLEATGVETIARRFVFTTKPVEVETRFLVSPAEPRTELRVTLAVADCLYNGEPVRRANAVITAEGGTGLDRIRIQPLVCERADGNLSGNLAIDMATSNIDVIAQSDMPVEPLMRILRVNFSPEKYGFVFPAPPPRLTATGRVPLDGNLDGIRIAGTVAAPTAMVRRILVQNLQCEFGIASNSYALRNVRAVAAGGDVAGSISLFVPPGTETQATYRSSFQVEHLDVETFAAQVGLTNRISGSARAAMELASCLGTNHDRCLNGSGSVRIEKGVLGRVPLFAGLTDYMARSVPGVELLVSQSEAQLAFGISNGVLRSEDLLVEGDVFSISGHGTYNFPADNLDFTVRTSVFKKRSWFGKIVNLVTFPFTKLLLEFRAHGPVEKPVWEYRGVIEKIVDGVGEAVGGKKESPP
jgi:hypothetical protein